MLGRLKAAYSAFVNYVDVEKEHKRTLVRRTRHQAGIVGKLPAVHAQPVMEILGGTPANPQTIKDLMQDIDTFPMTFDEKMSLLRYLAEADYRVGMHASIHQWQHEHYEDLREWNAARS